MCNLYDVGKAPRKMRFGWEPALKELLGGLTYVAPGKPGLIALADEGRISAARASWGFQRKFPGKDGKMIERSVNNTRDDKLDGRMWGKAFRERRCVIPVRRFYEWSGAKGSKTKHGIQAGDGEEWFWIAGIWEADGDVAEGRSYSMITTSAPESIEPIHDRCPLVLPYEKVKEFMLSEDPPGELVTPFQGTLSFDPPIR